jgi:crossover junction endodeoxyribonuclease RuvC
VLGIDTSLRSTGVGIVEARGSRLSTPVYDVLRVPARSPHSACLARIQEGIAAIIDEARPGAVAIEGVFYCKNPKTALVLGEARGAAIAACTARGLPVFEYAPRRVKQAVVGYGGADKEQVRKMVMSLLGLSEEPPEDAGDALAVAVCHLHNKTSYAPLMPEPI